MYVCMQTFAVPGTLSLSLLAGALYGTLRGLLLVSGKDAVAPHSCSLHTDAYLLCPSNVVMQRGFRYLSVISTLGASACYGMSWLCGREVAYLLWPDKLAHFSTEVKKQKTNMLSYIVLLRVTPVLPNTFINVASPMVDVPLTPFMLGKLAACLVCQLVAPSGRWSCRPTYVHNLMHPLCM